MLLGVRPYFCVGHQKVLSDIIAYCPFKIRSSSQYSNVKHTVYFSWTTSVDQCEEGRRQFNVPFDKLSGAVNYSIVDV